MIQDVEILDFCGLNDVLFKDARATANFMEYNLPGENRRRQT